MQPGTRRPRTLMYETRDFNKAAQNTDEAAMCTEFHVRQVVLTDTDTVWLRDPLPYLDRHPAVDVFTTTDCTSHEADSYFTNGIRRCTSCPILCMQPWCGCCMIPVWLVHMPEIPNNSFANFGLTVGQQGEAEAQLRLCTDA